jgi:hypothetical protein
MARYSPLMQPLIETISRTVLFALLLRNVPGEQRSRAESRAGAGSSFLVAGRAPASLRPLRAWPLRTSCRITDVTVLDYRSAPDRIYR